MAIDKNRQDKYVGGDEEASSIMRLIDKQLQPTEPTVITGTDDTEEDVILGVATGELYKPPKQ